MHKSSRAGRNHGPISPGRRGNYGGPAVRRLFRGALA